jgi:periplasmic protein TonB
VSGIAANDAALTPPADARETLPGRTQLEESAMTGMIIRKQMPVYPQDAKAAHASGKVVLQATIGVDGAVHDLRVVEAPWPSLVASALWSVSQWKYKPYLLNGRPVEVETTINVIFSLGP